MKTKKLNLGALNVESFITNLNSKEKETIGGGWAKKPSSWFKARSQGCTETTDSLANASCGNYACPSNFLDPLCCPQGNNTIG